MPEKIRMKIGRASYIQRIGEKDYLKTRSRIESVPMRRLVKLARMSGRTWRLHQEGNELFLLLEATTWEEEERASKRRGNPGKVGLEIARTLSTTPTRKQQTQAALRRCQEKWAQDYTDRIEQT